MNVRSPWLDLLEMGIGVALVIAGGAGWLFAFLLAGGDSALGDPNVWLQLAVLLLPFVVGVILTVHGGRRVVRRGL